MRDMISKVRHVTAEVLRVLNRLLRDNPFTYLSDTDGQVVGERFT